MNDPIVSVVMPVFNGGDHLVGAIESILNQSFTNFEFIIVNDGSTDKSLDIINLYAEKDKRIKVISRKNKGLTISLNEGVSLAKGEYIARMDADDISLPERFDKQVKFLKNTSIDLVSTGYEKIDIDGKLTGEVVVHPGNPKLVKLLLVFCSPICHPSVMGKKYIFQEFMYRSGVAAEDHELWCRIVQKYIVSNIEMPLLRYRVHPASLSKKNRKAIRLSTLGFGFRLYKVVYADFAELNLKLVVEELSKYSFVNLNKVRILIVFAKLIRFFSR